MPNGDATETVQFKSPTTGVVKGLGSDDWDEALSRGYTPVDHAVLYSPEGKRGMVPNAELRDYMKQVIRQRLKRSSSRSGRATESLWRVRAQPRGKRRRGFQADF
jgi:hypothetical protein